MKKRRKIIKQFKRDIINHKDELWIPELDIEYDSVPVSGWFDILRHGSTVPTHFQTQIDVPLEKKEAKMFRCKRVTLLLNCEQKQILKRWMKSCIMMYNVTVQHIKSKRTKENLEKYYQEKNIIMDEIKTQQEKQAKKDKEAKKEAKKQVKQDQQAKKEAKKQEAKKQEIDPELKKRLSDLETKYQLQPNFKHLRTYALKDKRNEIIDGSGGNKKIPVHVLDCAIKRACASFKSSLQNVKRGHQRHFQIRKIKFSKPTQVMEIEPRLINYSERSSIFLTYLGKIEYKYNDEIYSNLSDICPIESACNLQYSKIYDSFTLFVPERIDYTDGPKPNKIVSIDPGLRTFACCLSENEVTKICNNGQHRLTSLIERLDSLDNRFFYRKNKRKRVERRYRAKIRNVVDDMHWKTIKYLTDRYNVVLIGNLSTKSIINNRTSVLTKMQKRIAQELSFYRFRQRLGYKCKINNIRYRIVDESYTSKMCSCCGSIKDNLGASKIYDCLNCGTRMDRDVNGCRGIYVKAYAPAV